MVINLDRGNALLNDLAKLFFRVVKALGGADIALYVCAPVIASPSLAPGVQENRINRMSRAVGALGATVQ